MEEAIKPTKTKSGLKHTLLIIVTLIIGVAIGFGGLYLWKGGDYQNIKNELKTKTDKLAQLEKPADGEDDGPTSSVAKLELSDAETLQALTSRQVTDSSVAQYWLPIIQKISGDYAKSGPLPINFDSEQGYHVVPMGGITYVWHKKDGTWKKIGNCNETGCTMEAGYKYENLPKELTH